MYRLQMCQGFCFTWTQTNHRWILLITWKKADHFFTKLADVGQKKQTIAKYMENLKRFLRYIIAITSLIQTDRALFEQCKHFLLCLNELHKSMSKQVSKEITGKRYIFQIDPHRNVF